MHINAHSTITDIDAHTIIKANLLVVIPEEHLFIY